MTYRAKDIRFTRWGEPSRRAAATGGAALVATLGEAALSPVVKGTKQTAQNPRAITVRNNRTPPESARREGRNFLRPHSPPPLSPSAAINCGPPAWRVAILAAQLGRASRPLNTPWATQPLQIKSQGAMTCSDRHNAALAYARDVLSPFSLDATYSITPL